MNTVGTTKLRFRFVVVTMLLMATTFSISAQSILVDTYTERGKLAYEGGDLDNAEKLFKAALEEATKLEDAALMGNSSVNLGKVYHSKEQYDKAEPLYLKGIEIFDTLDGKDGERSAFAINNLGLMYADQKKFAKSEEYLRRALTIRTKILGSEDPDVAVTLLNLGKLYSDQSRFAEADAVYVRSLQILIQHPEMVEEILICLHNLGLSTQALGNPKRAESTFKMSISIIEKHFGSNSERLIMPLTGYAKFLRLQKRTSDAIPIERRLKLLNRN